MKPLINQHILVTRSRQQCLELIAAIECLGGHCLKLPCLTITKGVLPKYREYYDICITTSSNAVHSFNTKSACWIAVGPATATALQAQGINAVIPDRYNSEGILALAHTQSVAGKQIALFTGNDPKPLLYDTLKQRGADVDLIYCYRRSCPSYTSAELNAISQEKIDCIILNSNDTLLNLCAIFKKQFNWLIHQPILVISEQMQQQAQEIGFITVYRASDPSVDSICRALLAIGK